MEQWLICGNTFCTAMFRSGGEQLTLDVWFTREATEDSNIVILNHWADRELTYNDV